METEETKISVGGRIVIPKKMRRRLKIEEGEKVIIEIEGRKLIIKPKNVVEKPIEKLYGSVKVTPEENPKKEGREWMKERIEKDL
ncbi:MAG: AbrB/MazE/SpoVT family DNA-binding domain-containing protein [Candidatus Thermoplasmatota archaeon]|nr:AbrB/MazE/SpoVT family DNA-binding domain-containing protein [Candidatus Thermoplasmatota archaeon]